MIEGHSKSRRERESRPRQRTRTPTINRETVLKINKNPTRRHRSCCEFQWPPPSESHPLVNTNTQHFDVKMMSKKQVAEVRDFFDNYEKNMTEAWNGMSFYERYNKLNDNMTSSKSAENLKSDQQRDEDRIAKIFCGQQFPKNQSILSSSTPNLSTSQNSSRLFPLLKPLRKYFYLPEEKFHSSEFVKTRQHFDKSYDKQNSPGMPNTTSGDDDEQSKIAKTKNHNMKATETSFELKGKKFASSLNESNQKILNSSEPVTDDAMKFNESLDADFKSLCRTPEGARSSCSRQITAPLIKSNNLILCGGGLNDWKCEGNETDLNTTVVHWKDDTKRPLSTLLLLPSSSNPKQKHHHSRDLKPIKSLDALEHRRQQQHSSALMNDDCKLFQVLQDEQEAMASTSIGTCADKYCNKNSSPSRYWMNNDDDDDKNVSKINEISTTKSRINRKHNLNLDPFLDKELSAWISTERKRLVEKQQIELNNDNKIAITNIQIQSTLNDNSVRDDDVDELKSCEKLSNEIISTVANDYDNSTSSCCHQTFSDSFSSTSTSSSSSCTPTTTCANFEIDTPLIDTRHGVCEHDQVCVGKGRIFTDGEYLYGPYDFDLFCNEFYQFRDEEDDTKEIEASKRTNDDEAEIVNVKLLKNHDEVDNNAEVSMLRDVEAPTATQPMKGCEILRNRNNNHSNNRIGIEINVTNCSDDDEPDFTNDDVAFDRNFNYAPTETACGRNLIDLMDEGDNYVSNSSPFDDDLQTHRPTITANIIVEHFDERFARSMVMAGLLNKTQKFNYEPDKIVEITDENEYLFASPSSTMKVECSESCDDEKKFSNDEQQRREFIFVDCEYVDQYSVDDDTKNKIRFKELAETFRLPGTPQHYPSSSDANCDEPDNCFQPSTIGDRG